MGGTSSPPSRQLRSASELVAAVGPSRRGRRPLSMAPASSLNCEIDGSVLGPGGPSCSRHARAGLPNLAVAEISATPRQPNASSPRDPSPDELAAMLERFVLRGGNVHALLAKGAAPGQS